MSAIRISPSVLVVYPRRIRPLVEGKREEVTFREESLGRLKRKVDPSDRCIGKNEINFPDISQASKGFYSREYF